MIRPASMRNAYIFDIRFSELYRHDKSFVGYTLRGGMTMLRSLLEWFTRIPLEVQYLVLPLALIALLCFFPFRCKLSWLVTVLIAAAYLSILHLSGVWEMAAGYYTRFLLDLLLVTAAFFAFRKLRGKPFLPRLTPLRIAGTAVCAMLWIFLLILSVNCLRAYRYEEEPIRLQFPFRNGTFLINDGGDGTISSLVNYHYQDEQNTRLGYSRAERYANDIVELDVWGFEGRHFGRERRLEDYHIYDEVVYSPCDGVVSTVQEGYPDIQPNTAVTDTGNGVAIRTGDVYVMLWHLKKGSILVRPGDTVHAGDPLGRIGNSGITQTPHLHIHAARVHFLYGVGVPVVYDDKNPVKNRIMRVSTDGSGG